MQNGSVSTPETNRKLRDALNARLASVLDVHFDPVRGSPYWLERERELGINARRDIRFVEELDVFEPMSSEVFSKRSVWDFLPGRYRSRDCQRDLVLGETGGTTGAPSRTAYSLSDFDAAFVAPFVAAAAGDPGFPRGGRWLWVGPTGPHIVGKATHAVCHAMGSPEPFCVDFDPRWVKRQTPGSLGRKRYLAHVVEQALHILALEEVEVLFSTPPVLMALASELSGTRRERIRGVHLGGLALDEESARRLPELYPRASFLSGYGNTLLGMSPQLADRSLVHPRYYPHGDRLWLRFTDPGLQDWRDAPSEVAYGERGTVLATRLDESFLIINLLERDTALRLEPSASGSERGFISDGLEAPAPRESVSPARVGIY